MPTVQTERADAGNGEEICRKQTRFERVAGSKESYEISRREVTKTIKKKKQTKKEERENKNQRSVVVEGRKEQVLIFGRIFFSELFSLQGG